MNTTLSLPDESKSIPTSNQIPEQKPARRGRPPTLKCRGDGDKPCPDDQRYSEETKDLFLPNIKSLCKKCHAINHHKYYENNKERCQQINREASRKYYKKNIVDKQKTL
jgi:hypothetical protein